MASSTIAVITSSFIHHHIKPYAYLRSQALSFNHHFLKLAASNFNNSNKFRANYCYYTKSKRNSFTVYANSVPEVPMPTGSPPSGSPRSWIIGIVISLILPFFTNKWGPLWVLKNRIDNAVQTVEDITEAIEKVSEKIDEIAEDIGDDLPEGSLKKLVNSVENVAEKTAKAAGALDDIIDKVQEAEEQVESIVESTAKEAKNTHNS